MRASSLAAVGGAIVMTDVQAEALWGCGVVSSRHKRSWDGASARAPDGTRKPATAARTAPARARIARPVFPDCPMSGASGLARHRAESSLGFGLGTRFVLQTQVGFGV